MRAALAIFLLSLVACGTNDEDPVRVLAASSMTDAVGSFAERFTRETGVPTSLSFDATSRLARQIKEGAPADIFVAADARWVDEVSSRAHERRVLAHASLVLVARDPDLTLASLGGRPLALAGGEVPAGRLAREALEREQRWENLRVVRARNVRAALAWAASGEVDAAVVYATDALVEDRVHVVHTFASPRAEYIATCVGDHERARDFFRALFIAPELRAHGFDP